MNNNGNDNQFNNYYGGSGSNDNYGQPNFSSGQDFDPNSQNYSGGNYSGGFNPNQQYQDNSFNKDANSYGNYNGFNNGYGSGYNNGSYYNNQPSSGSFDNDPNQGKAVAALVMGIIGFSLAILGIIFFWGFSCSAIGAASRASTYLYDSSDLAGAGVGVIVSAVMTVISFIISIIGIVLGASYKKISGQMGIVNDSNKSKNNVGFVFSIIGLIFSSLSILSCVTCVGCTSCFAKDVYDSTSRYDSYSRYFTSVSESAESIEGVYPDSFSF